MDRLCVDCKHCWYPPQATGSAAMIESIAACHHESAPTCQSRVTGDEVRAKCRLVRRDADKCGPDGAWFEGRRQESGS